MKLLRVGPLGSERPVLGTDDGRWLDLSPITDEIDGAFLASGGIDRARAAIATLSEIDIAGQRIGAPVARPRQLLGVGLNYADHAAETGAAIPTSPIVFAKATSTMVGPDDDVVIPAGSTTTDYEVELAVIIGRPAHRLASVADAAAVIAGYAVANDVSERELQIERGGGQWYLGKSCPTFNPVGPWLVPADDVADVGALSLQLSVNGEVRQSSSTSNLIFGVHDLVHRLSQHLELEPGDVINTGTPGGVALSGQFPYLRAGDVVELTIEGLGTQRQRMVDA